MAHPEHLDRLVRRVAAQVRRRRAEHHALRGAFWASLPAVVVIALKGPIGSRALAIAVGLVVAGAVGGALWGFLSARARRMPRASPIARSVWRIA